MSIKKNSKVAKVTSAFVGFSTAFMMMGGVAILPASAATVDELLAQITALTAQLNALKGTTTTTGSASLSGITFSRNLKQGDTGEDVRNLQKVLNSNAATQVASTGAGSPGSESSFFGPATKAAVIKFQNMHAADILAPVGLTNGTGFVGASTRAKLNAMAAVSTGTTGGTTTTTGGTTTTTGTVGTGLTVSAPSQPANALAPQSAARLPFTKVTLTAGNDGDVTVNGFVIERGGPANDSVFSGVVLLDENGLQLGDEKTFNSDHRLTVGQPVVVKAGTSKTYTIAGNMSSSLSTFAGQVAVLSVVGLNTTATVTGALPISGAAHTINASLQIGAVTATVSSFDPNSPLTKEIGTTNHKFAGIRIQAGSAEKIYLKSIRWNQTGSVGSGDLANLVTVVDGTSYPTVVSADGKYYTATFGSGILIDKGFSKDIHVQGDIVGSNSSGRTVQFDIYKATDLYVSGDTFGFGITTTAQTTGSVTTGSEFTTGTPFFSGSLTTVSAGSITTITKSASVPSQNIAVNVPNQPLGGFDLDIKGESITVQNMVYTIASSSGLGGGGLLTNVSLVDQNGKVVAGPVDATDSTPTDGSQTVTFTDTVTFPIGKGTYTLKGRLPSAAGNNQQFVASTNPSTGWTNVRGLTSGNNLTLTNGSFSMNTMTVKAASLAIIVKADPVVQNIVAGGSARTFANYQFDASQSGEDVRFSSIPLELNFGGSASASSLTNCQLWDGTTALNTGSNVVNPSGSTGVDLTFTFDQQLIVTKGTVKTLSLKCTVSGSAVANNTFSWGIDAATANPAVTGVISSNNVAETITDSDGQTQTIAASSFTVQLDSSTPSYAVASGGSTGAVLGVLKLRATNEAVNLERLALQMSNSSASSSPVNMVQVTIWDGTTQVGTAVFTGSSRFATSTFATSVVLPKDQDKTLTIKGDLASIGQSQTGTQGALIQVDYDGGDSTGTQGSGQESGSRINTSSTSDTAVAGLRVYKSYPIFTYSTSGGVANNGLNDLLLLNVQADSKGEVQLRQLVFSVSTTTATLSSPTFNGPNGSVGTAALNGLGTLITVTFDSTTNTQDRTIAAGQSKSFTLRGIVSLTGTNTTGSVTTALKADTAHGNSGLTTLMGTVSQLAGVNIIWSPSATSTAATTDTDWANGFGLPGCFLTSGLGQDCQSRTIAK